MRSFLGKFDLWQAFLHQEKKKACKKKTKQKPQNKTKQPVNEPFEHEIGYNLVLVHTGRDAGKKVRPAES